MFDIEWLKKNIFHLLKTNNKIDKKLTESSEIYPSESCKKETNVTTLPVLEA